jgi:arylamine N-acetyltransferase
MPSPESTPEPFEQYLRLLGIRRRKPSYDALAELVAANIMRIAFENVSKLYCKKRAASRGLPDLKRYLDEIELYNFGGTCYANNYYLYLLLQNLGYEVMLCGADMANPDVHMVNLVSVDGREFLIDAGYAAPFLEPLPRDSKQDYVISLGRDRYVLKPRDKKGCSRMELYRDGQLKHGYLAKPIPRQIEDFARVIEDSYNDSATFMNALLLVRLYRNRSVVIHNLSVIQSEGTDFHVHQLTGRDELPMVVEKHFSIPHAIVSEAVAELGEFGDAWN